MPRSQDSWRPTANNEQVENAGSCGSNRGPGIGICVPAGDNVRRRERPCSHGQEAVMRSVDPHVSSIIRRNVAPSVPRARPFVLIASLIVTAAAGLAGALALGEAPGTPAPSTRAQRLTATASAPAGEFVKHTPAEVEALIAAVEDKLPDWWGSVALSYPPTLDLTGKGGAQQGARQEELATYIRGVINPDPAKWREGVKLLYQARNARKGNPPAFAEAAAMLGDAYFHLLRDWPRAAECYRQAVQVNRTPTAQTVVDLAECYWRLGSAQMARELLDKYGLSGKPYYSVIKLRADMGDTTAALALANRLSAAGLPDEGNLYAGYACRRAGMNEKALEYYAKALAVTAGSPRIEMNKQRAAANSEAMRLRGGLDVGKLPDGTYSASSRGYKGDVQVELIVAGGRIQSTKVVHHTEDACYTAPTDVPSQITEKQGVDRIDAVTGATATSEAIVNAATKALAGAGK
jgi:uncharacterized protein with FMN-binding domain